jgi:hypothetical protein
VRRLPKPWRRVICARATDRQPVGAVGPMRSRVQPRNPDLFLEDLMEPVGRQARRRALAVMGRRGVPPALGLQRRRTEMSRGRLIEALRTLGFELAHLPAWPSGALSRHSPRALLVPAPRKPRTANHPANTSRRATRPRCAVSERQPRRSRRHSLHRGAPQTPDLKPSRTTAKPSTPVRLQSWRPS